MYYEYVVVLCCSGHRTGTRSKSFSRMVSFYAGWFMEYSPSTFGVGGIVLGYSVDWWLGGFTYGLNESTIC